MDWQLGVLANSVIMVAYAAISVTIFRGLRAAGSRIKDNKLAAATGAIFATCSAGHAEHLIHLAGLPGVASSVEIAAARVAYDWHMALVDLATAAIGITFWTLRAGLSVMVEGPNLYTNVEAERVHARRVNDEVVQPLILAAVALEGEDSPSGTRRAIQNALDAAREIANEPFTDGRVAFSTPTGPSPAHASAGSTTERSL